MRMLKLVIGAALVGTLAACTVPAPLGHIVKPHASLVATNDCVGDVITVARGEQVGCNVNPPQVLNETGHDAASCAEVGGVFVGGDSGECDRVDF